MNIADITIIVAAATPILLAGIGELVVEKSGVLNLGVEGMMLVGAVMGFLAALMGYSAFWCFFIAGVSGMLLALLFATLTVYLHTNQVATGLAIAILGTGLSSLIGANLVGKPFEGFAKIETSLFDNNPVLNILLSQDIIAYFAIFIVFLVYFFLNYSKLGLILKAVGDNHNTAFALGYSVTKIRVMAILFGGIMAGFGGAYMSLVSPHLWTLQITGGRGWIALALVVFATWKPMPLLLGAYFFGAINVFQYSLQDSNIKLPPQFWASAPYIMTILVLVLVSIRQKGGSLAAPKMLGKSFIR